MRSESQEIKILARVKETVKLFLENDGLISDEQLAHILTLAGITTSSSTVGRDLTGAIAKEILDPEVYDKIIKLRVENKLRGNQKGGQISAINNIFQKDKNGKFTGSKRNGR